MGIIRAPFSLDPFLGSFSPYPRFTLFSFYYWAFAYSSRFFSLFHKLVTMGPVRELGPRYKAWALEPLSLGPKPHSTSYNHPHTWTLNLGPDTSEPNLGPRTRNKTTLNTLSKPPPIISNMDGRVLAWRHLVPSYPAVHLTTSLSNKWQK